MATIQEGEYSQSAACFDSWVKACRKKKNKDIQKLRTELYGEATIGSVPSGLRALDGVVAKRRAGTFGPSYVQRQ